MADYLDKLSPQPDNSNIYNPPLWHPTHQILKKRNLTLHSTCDKMGKCLECVQIVTPQQKIMSRRVVDDSPVTYTRAS